MIQTSSIANLRNMQQDEIWLVVHSVCDEQPGISESISNPAKRKRKGENHHPCVFLQLRTHVSPQHFKRTMFTNKLKIM